MAASPPMGATTHEMKTVPRQVSRGGASTGTSPESKTGILERIKGSVEGRTVSKGACSAQKNQYLKYPNCIFGVWIL